MELNGKNRISLFEILPKEGDYPLLKAIKILREKLMFSEEEQTLIGMELKENGLAYNIAKAIEYKKPFDFTDFENKIIQDKLIDIEKSKKLTDDTLELYDLFCIK